MSLWTRFVCWLEVQTIKLHRKWGSNRLVTGLALLAAVLVSGCLNVAGHLGASRHVYRPYEATYETAKALALPFMEKQYGEDGISQAWCMILFPVFLVEWPFEAVADTLTLPYDLWREL